MEQSPESVAHLFEGIMAEINRLLLYIQLTRCNIGPLLVSGLVLTEKDIEEICKPVRRRRSDKSLCEPPFLDSDPAVAAAVVDLLRQFAMAVGRAGDSLMHALQDVNPDDLWNNNRKHGRKRSCKKTKNTKMLGVGCCRLIS